MEQVELVVMGVVWVKGLWEKGKTQLLLGAAY